MKYDQYSPPKEGVHDDPRVMLYVSVDDLQIDPVVQRALQRRSPVWKHEWDWNRAEVPTVAIREDGTLVVVEGQNRVMKRREEAPGSRMWVVVALSAGREDEAAAALGISKGRKPHGPLDRWRLAAEAGNRHEVLAEEVLKEYGITLSERPTRTAISAVTALSVVIHSRDKTPEQGAALLDQVLKVITMTYGPDDDKRFEGSMIRGIASVFESNPDQRIDLRRLSQRMGKRTPEGWIALGKDAASVHNEPNAWIYIAREITRAYNENMRKNGPNRLTWQREL